MSKVIEMQDQFAALNSRTRLKILEALREKTLECVDPEDCDLSERCCNVGELVDRLDLTQPTVSHHLKELRRAGLIRTVREGQSLFCEIDSDGLRDAIDFLESFIEEEQVC